MNLKLNIIIVLYFSIANGTLLNLLNTADHKCAQCICNSIIDMGKSLRQCPIYSMSIRYWRNASSPKLNDDYGNERTAYRNCMANENCIVHTITQYTSRFYNQDCNCDGVFDCQDRFILHFDKCSNPYDIPHFETRLNIFRKCMNNKNALTEMCAGEDY